MADCNQCGAQIAPEESFCGSCGAQKPPTSPELKTISSMLSEEELPIRDDAGEAPTSKSLKISDDIGHHESLGGSSTDDVRVQGTSAAPHKGTTGGRQPAVKQLEAERS